MNRIEADSCRLQAGRIGLTCWHAACRYWRLCVGRALIPSFHCQESPHGPHRWPAAAWATSVSSRCTMYGHIYICVNKHTHLQPVHTCTISQMHTRKMQLWTQVVSEPTTVSLPRYDQVSSVCAYGPHMFAQICYLIEALRDSGTEQLSSKNALWLQGKELSMPNTIHMWDWNDSFVNCLRKAIEREWEGKESMVCRTIENNLGCIFCTSM